MAPFELEIARARHEELMRVAARHRLVALARCCQPAALSRSVSGAWSAARRLGALLGQARSRVRMDEHPACCT